MNTEQDPQEGAGLSRRDALKRAAVAGGAVMWAAPVVQALGVSPAGASNHSPVAVACPDRNSPPPKTLTLRFDLNPGTCASSSGGNCGSLPGFALEGCTEVDGGVTAACNDGWYLKASWPQGPSGGATQIIGAVTPGSNVTLDPGTNQTMNPRTVVEVFCGDPADGGQLRQTIQIHTSCSQPLCINDRYASLVLLGATF